MSTETVGLWVEITAGLVTTLSLPAAVITYRRSIIAERQARDRESKSNQRAIDESAFSKLYSDYTTFLTLCMEYPQFDLRDVPLENSAPLDVMEMSQALSMFNIFLCMAERAVLLYNDTSDKMKDQQYVGWREYIVEVLSRPRNLEMYHSQKTQYDLQFVEQVDSWLTDVRS